MLIVLQHTGIVYGRVLITTGLPLISLKNSSQLKIVHVLLNHLSTKTSKPFRYQINNNQMNRIVFAVLVLVMALASSCNQSSKSNSQQGFGSGNFDPEQMADRQIEEMKETIDLSGTQEKQMRELIMENFENMSKMREEMQNSGGGFEGMREQMQKVREEQDQKVKAILSEEQWEKYQTYQEERRARRGQGGPGGMGRPQ